MLAAQELHRVKWFAVVDAAVVDSDDARMRELREDHVLAPDQAREVLGIQRGRTRSPRSGSGRNQRCWGRLDGPRAFQGESSPCGEIDDLQDFAHGAATDRALDAIA